MTNNPKSTTENESTCVQLSTKTINELLYAIEEGQASDYLNDVEPSNNLVLC